MDWCTKPYGEANHSPVPKLPGATAITVKAGEGFELDASASIDPDGDNLSFLWYSYPEAGTYKEQVIKTAENSHKIYLVAPKVTEKQTMHIILQVTDKGEPQLSAYKRIIITILPA